MAMKLMYVEVVRVAWCVRVALHTTQKFFPRFKVTVKVMRVQKLKIWLHARSIGSDTVNGSECRIRYYVFTEPSSGLDGGGFSISFKGSVT